MGISQIRMAVGSLLSCVRFFSSVPELGSSGFGGALFLTDM